MYSVAALAVTLAIAGVVLTLPQPRAQSAPAGPPTLASVWKNAKPSSVPAQLSDGTQFSPLLYLDAQLSLGTAPTRDGAAIRLLLRVGDGTPTELRRLSVSQNPQFEGLASSGDDVVWAESTATAQGKGETRLWRANWRTRGPAAEVTADTGDIVFFNSQYDLVVANGRIWWAAVGHATDATTEVRSVPLDGGPVTARPVPGAYALSAWPWLVSAASGQAGAVDLVNLDSGQRVHVPTTGTELISCSPAWCRSLVLSPSGGPARYDMVRPDGSQRLRVAGGTASAAVQDVALLDRFEVVSQGGDAGPNGNQQLYVYDTKARQLVLVAGGVATVLARGGMLWWSTGDNETAEWHALDLRTLR
jgi:hypothetical protein